MRPKPVVVTPRARLDLLSIYEWLSEVVGAASALGVVERLSEHLNTLEHSYGRGQDLSHLSPGLRAAGFEKRATIIFKANEEAVVVLRIFYKGRDWRSAVADWAQILD